MLQALNSNIIIKPIYEEKKSSLIIPRSAKEYRQYYGQIYGEVISIGDDYPYKNDLKIGDKIYFQRHEGKKILYQGEMYLVLRERWIHGVIEE